MSKYKLTRFCYNEKLIPSASDDEEILQVATSAKFEETKKQVNPASDSFSNVISVLGDTHAGKSAFINALLQNLGEQYQQASTAVENEDADYAPTTGDANLYVASLTLTFENQLKDNRVFIIDYEGSNGSELLPTDFETEGQDNNEIIQDTELRRNTCAEHFPRLALMSSDVVVIMTELDLTNSITIKVISEIAVKQAFNGVENTDRPFLLIVSNKRGAAPKSIEESTLRFQKAHKKGFENLSQLYCDVFAMELPNWNIDNGRQLYEKQIVNVVDKLKNMLEIRLERKRDVGCLISEKSWFILFSNIVETSNQEEAMSYSKFLSEVFKYEKSDLQNYINFYTVFKAFNNNESYDTLRRLVMKFVVSSYIRHHFSIEMEDEYVLFSPSKMSDLKKVIMQSLGEMHVHMFRSEPCKAVNGSAECKEVRCSHGKNHFAVPSKNAIIKGLRVVVQAFKKTFFKNYKLDNWKGKFVPCSTQTKDQFVQNGCSYFDTMIDQIKQVSSANLRKGYYTIMMHQELETIEAELLSEMISEASGICILCMKATATPDQQCKHAYSCKVCKHNLSMAQDAGIQLKRCLLAHNI